MRGIAQKTWRATALLVASILPLLSTSSLSAIEPGGMSGGTVLVKWEAGEITLDQCLAYVKVVNRSDYKKMDEAALRKSLSEMATNEELNRRARDDGKFSYDKRMLEIAVASERRALLSPVYVEEEISKKTPVTEEEIRRSVGRFSPKYYIRVFSSPDRAKAELALSLLEKGEKFEDVARDHSEGMSAERGGYIGDIDEARKRPFSDEQFAEISRLAEGSHTGIIELPVGYVIVYMDRLLTEEIQIAAAAEKFRDSVKLDVERKKYQEKLESLRKKASVKWNKKVLKKFAQVLKEKGAPEIPVKLQREPLVRVNGKPIYAGEVVLRMGTIHNAPDLESFMERRIDDEIVVQEAARLGLESRVATELDLFRKNWIARRYLDFIGSQAEPVTPEDMRKYYDENPGKFAVPEKRAIQVIQVADRAVAEKVQAAIREGKDFDVLAQEYNSNSELSKAKGYAGYVEASNVASQVREKVFALEKGGISEILAAEKKAGGPIYVIVRVLDIRPASTLSFDRIDRRLVESRIVAQRREAALKKAFEAGPALEWQEEPIRKMASGG